MISVARGILHQNIVYTYFLAALMQRNDPERKSGCAGKNGDIQAAG